MKKTILIALMIATLVVTAGFLVSAEFPRILSFIMTKALGTEATVSSATVSVAGGRVEIHMRNIRLKGPITGSIGLWDLSIDPAEGLSVKEMVVSDFDLTVEQVKRRGNAAVPPARFFTIKDGIIRFNKEEFQVNRLSVENMDIGKQFLFTADLRTSGNGGRIEGSGRGIYEKRRLKMDGIISAQGIDLGRLSPHLTGVGGLTSSFTVNGKEIAFDGRFSLENSTVSFALTKTPLLFEHLSAKMAGALKMGSGTISITDLAYRGVLFAAEISLQKYEPRSVLLSSGLIDITDIKEYMDLDSLIGPTIDISSIGDEGKVRIEKISVEAGGSVTGSLELKGLSYRYDTIPFHTISGGLRFDEKRVILGPLTAISGTSTLRDFKGQIPTAGNRQVNLEGEYILALSDARTIVPGFEDLDINPGTGSARGRITVTAQNGHPPAITGRGSFSTPYAEWRKRGGPVKGDFTFNANGITFTAMTLSKGATELTGRGRFERNLIDFFVEGNLDLADARISGHVPAKASGISNLRLAVRRSGDLSVDGTIDMKETAIDVPQYFRKARGVPGKAKVTATRDGKGISIKAFNLLIDGLSVQVTGTIKKDGAIDLSTNVETDNIDKVARLFLVNDIDGKGFFKADFRINDLRFPIEKLPSITGSIATRGAFLKLPWFEKPLTNINLNGEFKDDSMNVAIHSLRCGQSTLSSAVLNLKGGEAPLFFVAIEADTINYEDFRSKAPFSLRPLSPGSLLAKARGDFLIKSKHLLFRQEKGSDFTVKGTFSRGRVTVGEAAGTIMDGQVEGKGELDLSKHQPEITVSGKLTDIRSGLLMNIFGGNAEIVEGRTMALAELSSRGRTGKELRENMKGTGSTLSKNGVIKRWNLLSKLFSLLTLNFYDIFRGKMDLSKDGLPFREMGASFSIDNGVFHTDTFIINSPSMMITGEGDINIVSNDIRGRIHVSPLIFVDTTIDKIPFLRTILKEKKKGFLHIVYDVTGPIDDPSLSISYVDSIGRRPIDVMRNLFLFPLEALK